MEGRAGPASAERETAKEAEVSREKVESITSVLLSETPLTRIGAFLRLLRASERRRHASGRHGDDWSSSSSSSSAWLFPHRKKV